MIQLATSQAAQYLFRLLRILLSVVVSAIFAVCLTSFLFGDPALHGTHRAAAPLFVMMFILPVYAAVAAVCFFLFDLWAARAKPSVWLKLAAPLVWAAVGFVVLAAVMPITELSSDMAKALVLIHLIFPMTYWLLTGRRAGLPGWSARNPLRSDRGEIAYLLVMLAIFGPMVLRTFRMLVFALWPAGPGEPPYQPQSAREMTMQTRAALTRFPDVQSCLVRDAKAANRDDLLRMDWDRIDNGREAEVCMFRLLSAWGGADEAGTWFEAQGLRASDVRPLSAYYGKSTEQADENLRVDAGWSIKDNGPLFPTSGLVRRVLRAVPYGYGVTATFDGKTRKLLYVSTSSSTL